MAMFSGSVYLDKSLDNDLSSIKGLKWLPWIGGKYLQTPKENRIMIIGESHYDGETKESKDKHDDVNYSRQVIKEMGIERNYWNSQIFSNLNRALFRNDNFNSSRLWEHTSFYNFIQTPMSSRKHRPNPKQILDAWQVFFKVRERLEPSICLFIGSCGASYLNGTVNKDNLTINEVRREDKISRTFAKYSIVRSPNGFKTDLIFIQHTSQYFSWDKWNKYLSRKMPDTILWLSQALKE